MITFYVNRMSWSEKRQKRVSKVEKVAMFITRKVTGCDHMAIANAWGVSEATAVKIFVEAFFKLNICFNGVFKLPTADETTRMKNILRLRGDDLWKILFVTDGTHIPSPISESWDSTY